MSDKYQTTITKRVENTDHGFGWIVSPNNECGTVTLEYFEPDEKPERREEICDDAVAPLIVAMALVAGSAFPENRQALIAAAHEILAAFGGH